MLFPGGVRTRPGKSPGKDPANPTQNPRKNTQSLLVLRAERGDNLIRAFGNDWSTEGGAYQPVFTGFTRESVVVAVPAGTGEKRFVRLRSSKP